MEVTIKLIIVEEYRTTPRTKNGECGWWNLGGRIEAVQITSTPRLVRPGFPRRLAVDPSSGKTTSYFSSDNLAKGKFNNKTIMWTHWKTLNQLKITP